jgi:hypothetical protein
MNGYALRRFLKAAQVCQKVERAAITSARKCECGAFVLLNCSRDSLQNATLHMEFLANCLAELTLLEYDFLKYLPSMIAGSAVFLAKFTLDPNVKPWVMRSMDETLYIIVEA